MLPAELQSAPLLPPHCSRTWRKRTLEKRAWKEEKTLSMKVLAVSYLKSPLHRTNTSALLLCLSSWVFKGCCLFVYCSILSAASGFILKCFWSDPWINDVGLPMLSYQMWGGTSLFVIPPTFNLETRGFQLSRSLPPTRYFPLVAVEKEESIGEDGLRRSKVFEYESLGCELFKVATSSYTRFRRCNPLRKNRPWLAGS